MSASWLSKIFGTPWRTLFNYLYVAANWSTISGDLEMYRKQIKDRDEWLATAEVRHRNEETVLNQRLAEWQEAANRTFQLASTSMSALQQTTGQLRQLQAQHIKLASDIVECAMLITITLHFQPAPARQQQLAVLLPGGRRIVEAGLAAADSAAAGGPEALYKAMKEQITLTLLSVY